MHVNIPWHANQPILIDMDWLSNCQACFGQLVKILITLEPCRIFESKFAFLFILILSKTYGMQNGGEGLPSIIMAGQDVLVEMLIHLEPRGIFII